MKHHQRPGHRALRKGRVSIAGHHYVLTVVSHRRRQCFLETHIAQIVADKLHDPTLWRDSTPLCWVLMPDHLHLLIRLGAAESLSRLVGRVKCITPLAANRSDGRCSRVWARGFHDRALRQQDDCVAIARYLLANPVKAGLVDSPADYRFRWCVWDGVESDWF